MKKVLPIKNECESEFNMMLREAIHETLINLVGEKNTQSIYFFGEEGYNLKPDEIVENIQDFEFLLEEIFGSGTIIIEQEIMKKLYTKVSEYHKNIILTYASIEQFNFLKYINDLKTAIKNKAVNNKNNNRSTKRQKDRNNSSLKNYRV
ncbi:MAG: hypothetical protein CW691_09955 [Candidatus Bathyarchaeum sp.]|nr:MAG: hypothetical protein CW691_09955 [Candidatus Bathyarchaeum sp.]